MAWAWALQQQKGLHDEHEQQQASNIAVVSRCEILILHAFVWLIRLSASALMARTKVTSQLSAQLTQRHEQS